MARSIKPLPLYERVRIEDVAAEGVCLTRIDERVVFVPFAAPGDVVDLQVRRKHRRYWEAEAVKFYEYSPCRQSPFCPHFGVCGGCKWQHLAYSEQLRYKQRQVYDAFTRIGHLDDLPEIMPILGSEQVTEYRGKLEFTFSSKCWLTWDEMRLRAASADPAVSSANPPALGFHIPGAFDKVLDIKECRLMTGIADEIRNAVRNFAIEQEISFEDIRGRTGLLRTLMLRTTTTGETMVCLMARVLNDEDKAQMNAVLEFIKQTFPQVTSLLYTINNKSNDSYTDLDINVYSGREYVIESMEDLRFRIGAKSFYQTNPQQAYRLYSVVRDMAQLTGSELVYDLYTGTGTIALFLARQAARVIGIEYVNDAIYDARLNAEENNIGNATFFAGDMKEILTYDFVKQHGKPDILITDPPRAGMHPDVIDVILQTAPKKIVYVSCNPATQARDLQQLQQAYKINAIQPVDMFPHTHHVENVVLLTAK